MPCQNQEHGNSTKTIELGNMTIRKMGHREKPSWKEGGRTIASLAARVQASTFPPLRRNNAPLAENSREAAGLAFTLGKL